MRLSCIFHNIYIILTLFTVLYLSFHMRELRNKLITQKMGNFNYDSLFLFFFFFFNIFLPAKLTPRGWIARLIRMF